MQTPPNSPLRTVLFAAAYLTLGKATVYRLLASGALPSVKIGKSRRLRQDDLDAFIASSRRVPSQPDLPAPISVGNPARRG